MTAKMTIIEGNSNDKDNVRAYMVKGEKGDPGSGGGGVQYEDIIDNLTSTETQKVLSANQGRVLNEKIEPLLPEDIKVHYIKSGTNKGDCIVIETNDKNMIIDFGATNDGASIIQYLNNKNINKIDYALVTHYHADHIGGTSALGLKSVINNANINFSDCVFLLPEELDTSKWHGTSATEYNNNRNEIITALTSKNISYRSPVEDEELELDKSAVIRLINCYDANNWDVYYDTTFHANGGVDDGKTELNNFSIVAELKHGKNIFLFTGDIEPTAQNIIKDKISTCDVYKIEHHGANDTTNQLYLEKIIPRFSICMNTENSNYNNRTLQCLRSLNIPIYTTNESGNVFVVSDKYNLYPHAENDQYTDAIRKGDFFKGLNVTGYHDLYSSTLTLLKSGDDLNNFITPGTYRSSDQDITPSILNKPTTVRGAGFIVDVRQLSNPNIILQVLYSTLEDVNIYYRVRRIISDTTSIVTEWTNWFTFDRINGTYIGDPIASGDDLNDYLSTGVFYSSGSAITNSLTNCPLTGTGFKLEVEYITDNSQILRQTIKVHNANSDTYIRTRWGGGSQGYAWQSWKKVNVTNA